MLPERRPGMHLFLRRAANYIPNNPYGTFYLLQENSSGKSNYNALQASLRTTDWHGMTSQANFVWSHSLDTSSDLEDFDPNASQPNDSFNPLQNMALKFQHPDDASLGISVTPSQDGRRHAEDEKWMGPQ